MSQRDCDARVDHTGAQINSLGCFADATSGRWRRLVGRCRMQRWFRCRGYGRVRRRGQCAGGRGGRCGVVQTGRTDRHRIGLMIERRRSRERAATQRLGEWYARVQMRRMRGRGEFNGRGRRVTRRGDLANAQIGIFQTRKVVRMGNARKWSESD